MKLRSYSEYKPSGIEWLGEIPKHWEVIRVKALEGNKASVVQTGPFGAQLHADDYVDDGVPLILIRNVGDMRIDTTDIPMVSHEDAERLSMYRLEAGDIVFSRVGSIGKIALCTEREQGWLISGQMLRLKITNPLLHSYFAAYAFGCSSILTFVELQSVGSTRESINTDILRNMPLPIPPTDEQHAIAAFLDRETARIDMLIEKKQRQIELLQEKRSALISHAVTKGLDPNTKMKDSRVEWIGNIPAHWEVKRLKFLVSEPLKYGANEAAELDDPELPRYIRITDVDENGRLRDETFKSIPEDVARPYLLKEGDLLLARSGATVGKSFYYEPSWGRAAYAGYLIRARFNPTKTMPRFINYFTNSQHYWQWLRASFIQATIQNVSAEKYANLIVPVPPFEEQKRIVSYLDSMWQRLNNMTDKVRQSIQVLKEYRSALISATVTGKIDIREDIR